MADVALIWKEMGADLSLENLALVRDDTLKTAVILSLFIDRRAEDGDELPGSTTDRRGWWADTYADVLDDRIGSRLWLLSREKQLPKVLVKAKEYAGEALAWMVEDGVVESVEVTAEWVRRGLLGLRIRLYKPNAPAIDYNFAYLWEAL
jgi:phage gp46-like protein